jgi:hypothetical protein
MIDGQGAMSDRVATEFQPPKLSNSNDNCPYGWFNHASATVDAARTSDVMPEVQWIDPPTEPPVGFWRSVWQRWWRSLIA